MLLYRLSAKAPFTAHPLTEILQRLVVLVRTTSHLVAILRSNVAVEGLPELRVVRSRLLHIVGQLLQGNFETVHTLTDRWGNMLRGRIMF